MLTTMPRVCDNDRRQDTCPLSPVPPGRATLAGGESMAAVTATHQWADGSAVQIKVEFWDFDGAGLAEAKTQAVAGLAEAVATFSGESE